MAGAEASVAFSHDMVIKKARTLAQDDYVAPVRLHPYRKRLVLLAATDEAPEAIRVLHCRTNWSDLQAR